MNSDIKYEKNERIKEILRKIHERRICVGVIGLGYVGLPLAMEFAQEGVKTLGFEVDNSKVSKLVAGENYIEDVDDKVVRKMVESEKFTATSDTSRMSECDAVFICVPTPFTENKDPDIRYILDAAKLLAEL